MLVTGATGRVGRAVVDLLIDAGGRSAPSRIAPGRRRRCRRTSKSSRATSPCPNLSTQVCEVSVPSSSSGPPRRRLLRQLSSVSQPTHVVSSFSHHHTKTPHPFFQQPNPMAVLHADIERLIAAAGLESTIIRPGILASNALFWWATAIRADGIVRWPYGAAETVPVDELDVAAVAARTLYQDGHDGGDYVLTGPESLSQAEQVSIIGDVLGRRIKFEELSSDEFRSETEASWPRPLWTCCSPCGAQRLEGRRSSPRRCSTSSDRRRDRFASGSLNTPPRLWKVQPHRARRISRHRDLQGPASRVSLFELATSPWEGIPPVWRRSE